MKEEETHRKKATVKKTSEVYKGRIFNFVTEALTILSIQMAWFSMIDRKDDASTPNE